MGDDPCDTNEANSGVNLDRNFGFMFGTDNVGSEEEVCS
jgi:hypothetical protein